LSAQDDKDLEQQKSLLKRHKVIATRFARATVTEILAVDFSQSFYGKAPALNSWEVL